MRFEKKFILPGSKIRINELILSLLGNGFKPEHKKRMVNSIYLSDFSYKDFTDHQTGMSERKKDRLRWYGERDSKSLVVFETKHRISEMGYKAKLYTNLKPNLTDQCSSVWGVTQAFDCWLIRNKIVHRSKITPLLLVQYTREYFVNIVDKTRVTIDFPIKYAAVRKMGNLSYVPEKDCVIEVKYDNSGIEAISRICAINNMQLSKNSKFINGVKKCLLT